ncbi:MAG: hypothetical protein ACE3L7_00145 [Candidatus Pristimantibacillus sp.]
MIIWKTEWINAYETPWSIFEKLCFANHITRTDLLKTLGSTEVRQIRGTLVGDKRRELINLSGFDHPMLHKYLDFDLAAQNNTDIKSILKPIEYIYENIHTWFPTRMRWCPDCMRYGYHSWIHQFIMTKRCPFHDNELLESCPSCSNDIPFLLSDRRMNEPFTCICGYKMAEFSCTHWTEWKHSFDIKNTSMGHWLKGAAKGVTERFLFVPSSVSINLFSAEPVITYKINNRDTNRGNTGGYPRCIELMDDIYNENINCFKAIDRYIKRKYLKYHRNCILSFQELRKHKEGEFPPVCPYAYAYVLWKHTLLRTSYFYKDNPKLNDFNLRRSVGLEFATQLVAKHIKYIKDKLFFQTNISDVDNRALLHQIMNRYTSELCFNYFYQWLAIAKEGSRRAIAPKWNQIEQMIEMSLPNIIFKHDENVGGNDGIVQVFKSEGQQKNDLNLECMTNSTSMKKQIRNMSSYTPLRIAMKIFDNPSQENKELSKYVDKYVARFSI